MGDLLIRNLSSSVEADLLRIAEQSGVTLADAAKAILEAGIEPARPAPATPNHFPRPGDHMRALLSGAILTDEEARDFQTTLDQLRRAPGRPLPFQA